MTIVVCEPQCRGFEHASFNAALLLSMKHAFPRANLRFLADPGHLSRVAEVLSQTDTDIPEVCTLEGIRTPGRRRMNWGRLPSELSWCHRMADVVRHDGASLLVVSSVVNTTILALEGALATGIIPCPVVAVIHGALSSLLFPRPRRPWNAIIALKTVLHLPQPRNLGFLVLGEEILRTARELGYGNDDRWMSIDHPYVWPATAETADLNADTIRFGFFGVGTMGAWNKNFQSFLDLAGRVRGRTARATFEIVGFTDIGVESQSVQGCARDPLPHAEYLAKGRGIHYAVSLGNPAIYRLCASGSFLDAMALAKPVIAMDNAYLRSYTSRLGDIGYLCHSIDVLEDTICQIAEHPPWDRYIRQRQTILQGRRIFEPAAVGSRFRSTLSPWLAEIEPRREKEIQRTGWPIPRRREP
ncbi:MAG TPA: hypothetical protein VKU19_27250 [Bryobacteraceae bacterium]|nr:hypothetical protein [Bryobacteraceae bacterium]